MQAPNPRITVKRRERIQDEFLEIICKIVDKLVSRKDGNSNRRVQFRQVADRYSERRRGGRAKKGKEKEQGNEGSNVGDVCV